MDTLYSNLNVRVINMEANSAHELSQVNVMRDALGVMNTFGVPMVKMSNIQLYGGETQTHIEGSTACRQMYISCKPKIPLAFDDVIVIPRVPQVVAAMNQAVFHESGSELTFGESGVPTLTLRSGDTVIETRLSPKSMAPKLPEPREVDWDVTLVPDQKRVKEFRSFTGLFNDVAKNGTPSVTNGKFIVTMGDAASNSSTHSGAFEFGVYDENLNLTPTYSYDNQKLAQAMVAPRDSQVTLKISKLGVVMVELVTPYADYRIMIRPTTSR